jgi:hypothetical protein
MDRSLFLARLMGPTFVAIALGMLINLGMYERMIVEALHTGILFYLSGLLSLLAGLVIVNLHNTWYADWRATDRGCGRFEHLWRPRQHDRSRADRRRTGCFLSVKGYLQRA